MLMSGGNMGVRLWLPISGASGGRERIISMPWTPLSKSQAVRTENASFSWLFLRSFLRRHTLLHQEREERIGHVHYFAKSFFALLLPYSDSPILRRGVVDLLQFASPYVASAFRRNAFDLRTLFDHTAEFSLPS
jgi:hypothetical protein